jgi:Alpha-glutamyl/putrescinyl thymine pyrophosphorylase clade 3
MPTFCRHNRFLERCPICSRTLPGSPQSGGSQRSAGARARTSGETTRRRGSRGESLRVRRESRAEDDGYRSALLSGLRASTDAHSLAQEIAFSSGRLHVLAEEPPGLYGEARRLAAEDPERATWICFLTAYLSPLEGEDPFAGIRPALAEAPEGPLSPDGEELAAGELPDLRELPLGPRSSHERTRGAETLIAYGQWVRRAGGPGAGTAGQQAIAFRGDPAWSAQRRFERLFERLALPGFARRARYDLLVTLGRLGVYELRPDSLHLGGARGLSADDPTTLAAKRVFGIGDPLLLERRAAALAEAVAVPVETLDLALANWASPERATMGVPPQTSDSGALERAGDALGL